VSSGDIFHDLGADTAITAPNRDDGHQSSTDSVEVSTSAIVSEALELASPEDDETD
jgi:hypothetical protein